MTETQVHSTTATLHEYVLSSKSWVKLSADTLKIIVYRSSSINRMYCYDVNNLEKPIEVFVLPKTHQLINSTQDKSFLCWKEGSRTYGLVFASKSACGAFLQLIQNFDRNPTPPMNNLAKGAYLTDDMQVLHLDGRNLNIDNIKSLSTELQKSQTLKELHLPKCNIGAEGIKLLCDAISNNISITKLNLRENCIKNEGAEYISTLLKSNPVLTDLNLADCKIESHGMNHISKSLKVNTELLVLDVRDNNINDTAVKSICAALMKNFTLQRVEFEGNSMSSDSHEMIENCIMHRKVVQQAVIQQDWNTLKKFVRENPEVPLSGIIPKQVLNLQNRMHINAITSEVLSASLPKLKITTKNVKEKVRGLAAKHKRLKEEEKSLEERLKLLKKEIINLSKEQKQEQSNLQASETILFKAEKNYQNSQSFIQLNQAKFDDWKQQMSVDMSKWNTEDILFLLNEIQLTHRSKIFIDNKIDGSVVTSLTSNDLTKRGMTFKETKLLLKSLYLIQKFKNLYVDPPAVFKWRAQEVFNWLNINNFANLAPILLQKEISGSELVFLDRSDLESHLEIKSLGDCIKLEKAIRELYGIHLDSGSDNKIKAPSPRQAIVPEQFYCPITHEIMTDPVVTSDGHTYERSAIESWLKNHNTSPVTNQPLEHKGLVPSYSLKSMIMDFLAHQNK